ncbi:hypothetical protein GOEFS_064_00150 [Gordonia effusa NBRC 100432]|uniref:DUF2550 family protein n=1 Tax=Gordonia effusa NBRC 100432 TaxID=1077974 RepID=H0R125_9ACTN|nr:DUF2550 family protein [Gordonia effusa]GAB18776.1 hypothetical protein GOEFS_064_00150 [Gordonia effusa NBRC 100432]
MLLTLLVFAIGLVICVPLLAPMVIRRIRRIRGSAAVLFRSLPVDQDEGWKPGAIALAEKRAELYDTDGNRQAYDRLSLEMVGRREASETEQAMFHAGIEVVVVSMRSGSLGFELALEPGTATELQSWLDSRNR